MDVKVTDKENWTALKMKIKELKIFNPENYAETFLSRRIECRLRATCLNSYSEYAQKLTSSEKEREALCKDLTINVTSFFRDTNTYQAIKEEVMPFIVKTKEETGQNTINVWSAGAASGEEAYSLAILFKEVLGTRLARFKLSIIGTDIDREAIAEAKQGVYNEQQLRETDPAYIKRYFEKTGNSYRITDDIKKMVRFEQGDILGASKPRDIDLLLCRNTVIYFNAETKAKLYADFYNIMKRNGFLILGKTEILLGNARELFQIFNSSERVYCKE
ncbi:MAG: protein-glutamate O-methyltransferase CheR [archaeon]